MLCQELPTLDVNHELDLAVERGKGTAQTHQLALVRHVM